MSNPLVNDITLQYFSKKGVGKKLVASSRPATSGPTQKERRFYRKRILELSKSILAEETAKDATKPCADTHIPNDVRTSFRSYMNNCVEYFKYLDTSEIIQKDYDGLVVPGTASSHVELKTQEFANELFTKNIKYKPNTLDTFVVHTKADQDAGSGSDLPRKKNIKLTDPVWKNKGVKKKNNLRNTYEEASKETPNDGQEQTAVCVGQQKHEKAAVQPKPDK